MKKSGFTLIELSIVLVIISLIVGGIVGGKSLIHSARLNSVVSEVGQYETAFKTFYLQYDSWPGDMRDADEYWPTTYVRVGNGNNVIGDDGSGTCGYMFLPWLHLQLAEIIPGHYSGCEDAGSAVVVPGENMPTTKLHPAGYYEAYTYNNGASLGDHFIRLRRQMTSSPFRSDGAVMTVADAIAIQVKINGKKGVPGLGKATFGSAHTDDTHASAVYCTGGGSPETSYFRKNNANEQVCEMDVRIANR